jgi:predicted RNA-binding Zn ribbon-like protein
MIGEQTGRGYYFIGESLCLDFVNTEVMEAGNRTDLLRNFDDFVAWYAAAQLVNAVQASDMMRQWSGGRDAERTFTQAVEFRATLRVMVERLATGRTAVHQAVLDSINDVLRAGAGDLKVVRTKTGYETRYRPLFIEPAHLLVPIARSAADLLSTSDLTLVRKCQNPQCILYFYDTTKNHARRWCSMAGCGNRAKAAAHYRRTRRPASTK